MPAAGASDPIAAFAKRLGWEESAGDLVAVFEWNREVETERNEFLETHSKPESGAEEVRRSAEEFNERTRRQRQKLVQLLGSERADQVLSRVPLYRFDMNDGSWYRVDAKGQRREFQDPEKENLWQGFIRLDH